MRGWGVADAATVHGCVCRKPPQPTATFWSSWSLGVETLDRAPGDGLSLLHEAQGLSWGFGRDDSSDQGDWGDSSDWGDPGGCRLVRAGLDDPETELSWDCPLPWLPLELGLGSKGERPEGKQVMGSDTQEPDRSRRAPRDPASGVTHCDLCCIVQSTCQMARINRGCTPPNGRSVKGFSVI